MPTLFGSNPTMLAFPYQPSPYLTVAVFLRNDSSPNCVGYGTLANGLRFDSVP